MTYKAPSLQTYLLLLYTLAKSPGYCSDLHLFTIPLPGNSLSTLSIWKTRIHFLNVTSTDTYSKNQKNKMWFKTYFWTYLLFYLRSLQRIAGLAGSSINIFLNHNLTKNSIKKWKKNLNKYFSKKDIQKADKHRKRCLISLIIRHRQIKPSVIPP